jgi:methyl-accepting chemotaxis protein
MTWMGPVFKNMKVWQRLTLISLSFSLPIAVLLYFVTTGINSSINFAVLENYGNQYQRPLEQVLNLLPQHQWLARRYLSGETSVQREFFSTRTELDKAFEALEAVHKNLAVKLQFTDEGLGKRQRHHLKLETVGQEWQELKAQVTKLQAGVSDEKHLHLASDIKTMITHAGDTSNLILDPDLDSYYLMDVTLLALPQTQDRLASIITFGSDALLKESLSSKDRTAFAVYAAQLKEADFDRVNGSTQTSLNEDQNFYGVSATLQHNVPPALEAYSDATQAFVGLLTRVAESTDSVSRDEFIAAGTKARAASFALWRVDAAELDVLLETRIADYQHFKVIALSLTALAVAAAALLVFFIMLSITRPLAQSVDIANQIALGNLAVEIDVRSTDETGQLLDAMRNMTRSLNQTAQAAASIADGDLSVEIVPRSEHDVVSKNLLRAVDKLHGLVAETKILTKAALDGNLTARGNASKFQGVYRELVEGINATMDAVIVPINEASDVLQQIAGRNLGARATGDYRGDFAKIKDALNTAAETLDGALGQVAAAADQVTTASHQITIGSETLAQGASEQATSLVEVSSNLNAMSFTTRRNASNAQEARSLSEGARLSAERGMSSMKRLSQEMDKIKASAYATAKIMKTIDEIAFQTNLLALNAAVEAARAGDAGRGFAVVAEEVRNLAMRSAEAAKNTASLIDEAVKNVDSGVQINEETLKNLSEINQEVHKVRQVMEEIAAASENQSHGIEQVNSAVEQMNQVTHETAANAEQSASAAQELSRQAKELKEMVASFELSPEHGVFAYSHAG